MRSTVKDVQTAAGVSYAVANRDVLRNEELGLVYGLEPGNEQLLNGKEADSNVSVWVPTWASSTSFAPCPCSLTTRSS